MTLQALKDKATAAEITLIEAVESAVRGELEHEARMIIQRRLDAFLTKNPIARVVGPDLREWAALFDEALRNSTP